MSTRSIDDRGRERATRALARHRFLAAAAVCASLASAVAAQDKIALQVGQALTLNGEPIEDASIVIIGGRVTAVGKTGEVEVPWDAVVHRFPDSVAFPGFVEAHTSSGMDRPNESLDVAPFLDIRDSLDPVNNYFEEALRGGITTIGVQQGSDTVIAGQGMVVKPYGMTVEEMLVRPGAGLKMSATPKRGKSRATQAQALREAFGELRRHLEELVQDKRDGNDQARREALYQGRDLTGENAKGRAMEGVAWKVEGLEIVPRGEIDEKQEPLLAVVEGRLPVWFDCEQPMDVHLALRIARENGFLHRTSLVLGAACWKAADVIAEAGVPVVLTELVHVESDPLTGDEEETSVVEVFRDAGVPFALQSSGASTQALWFQAAMAMGHGLTREEALAAVTTTPASMLGLDSRVGKIAPGFDGNVVLFSGDPLAITSHVQYVVLEGQLVYDRSKDVRMKHLYEGVQPENTMAEGEDGRVRAAPQAQATQQDPAQQEDDQR